MSLRQTDLTLYLVLDPDLCGGADGMVETAAAAARGGCTIVQLRAPRWKKRQMAECGLALLEVLKPFGIPLIVDDHVDVAMAIRAQGVHIGQKDLPPEMTRALLGADAIVGWSVSNASELEASRRLASDGVIDYLGIGPIATTSTKPDAAAPLGIEGFATLAARLPCPAVAIGSVNAGNAPALARAGADGIAVVSAICGQPDPRLATERLLAAFRQGLAAPSGNLALQG